ncbi:hypothetical protein [Nocardioides bruguierae]|uniref:hypothetical protein n=1 Tax=Nocardioides bruguierae TaxID=2945102 RepID=UPI0020206998|nr:hypothetical protein [Nocardioides bruguierae]MCL8023928.1 hypothetical protein [Nocardioides bruguierae]
MPHPSMRDPHDQGSAEAETGDQHEASGAVPDGLSSARASWSAQPAEVRARKLTTWLLLGGTALMIVSAAVWWAVIDNARPARLDDLTTVLFITTTLRYVGIGCVATGVVALGVRLGLQAGRE